ncbi:hypothetical protein POM88_053972 [Heracleum sosnowskyi]|uniref:DUF569 domain-containing protein n=1 Tax=Heracleum sosnowskyi TaxID=360622 RepID=A0AAD8GNM1_9APIA|nr:hypothetical protein POM88_053972 [Heracleum sosnowskyi]
MNLADENSRLKAELAKKDDLLKQYELFLAQSGAKLPLTVLNCGPGVYHTITQGGHGSSEAALWTVELLPPDHNIDRLKSCYNKYLTTSNLPFLYGMRHRKLLQMQQLIVHSDSFSSSESTPAGVSWPEPPPPDSTATAVSASHRQGHRTCSVFFPTPPHPAAVFFPALLQFYHSFFHQQTDCCVRVCNFGSKKCTLHWEPLKWSLEIRKHSNFQLGS